MKREDNIKMDDTEVGLKLHTDLINLLKPNGNCMYQLLLQSFTLQLVLMGFI
jgi:hypothetical protein